MRTTFPQRVSWVAALVLLVTSSLVFAAERYKPYVLGSNTQSDYAATVKSTEEKLKAAGFRIVGEYVPFADTHILIVTNPELLKNAAASQYGGFGAIQRVSIVKRGDKVEVAYTNPIYMAYAYRMKSHLNDIADQLGAALGHQTTFGAKRGLYPEDLLEYHYTFGMEYFNEPYHLAEYPSHSAAIAGVEKHLTTNKAGIRQLYRLDIPGKQETVYGVSMKAPNPDSDEKYMDDTFQMSIIDHNEYSQAAYLPYEVMVIGNKVIALHMRFRAAVNFPSLRMVGHNSFMTLRSSPEHIQTALSKAVGGRPDGDDF
jgi:hypothetical protein